MIRNLVATLCLLLSALYAPFSNAAEFLNVTLDDGTEAILIASEIEVGDEEKFRKLSIEFESAVVVLASNGGALLPALEIGRQIRLRSYSTLVLDQEVCVSACALIWLAGKDRILSGQGAVGFHASYIDEDGELVESGMANAIVGYYLSQLNLSERAVVFATYAPPDQVAWLTAANKDHSPIRFDVWNRSEVESSSVSSPPFHVARNGGSSEDGIAYLWLNNLAGQPGFAQNSAYAIGARGAVRDALANHIKLLFSNESLIRRAARELDAAKIEPGKNEAAASTILFNLSTSSTIRGLRRLPQRDVNRFFEIFSLAINLPSNRCAGFLKVNNETSPEEFQSVYALGDGILKEYLQLIRKSVFAEVEEVAPPIELTKNQIEIAENAWASVLTEYFDGNDSEYEEFLTVINDLQNNPEDQSCRALGVLVGSVDKMDGLAGDWMRRVYISYMVDGT